MAETTPKVKGASEDLLDQYEKGRRNWMGRNQWSHPVMVALARQVCGNSWLHNSQISGLRHAGLTSPGPRQFIALEQLNKAINKYQLTSKTIPGTDSSRTYKNTQPIIEAGATESPPLGWFIEVFCGCREPNCPKLVGKVFSDKAALEFSKRYGRDLRARIAASGEDLVEQLASIINRHYPAREDDRVAKRKNVLMGQDT